MKTTFELLEAARLTCTPPTYYRLSKRLGISRQAMTRYRLHGGTFDDPVAVGIAEILDLDPGYVLACMGAERAKHTPSVRRVWEKLAKGLAQGVSLVLLGAGLTGAPPPCDAGGIEHNAFLSTHYATRKRFWAWLAGAKLALP